MKGKVKARLKIFMISDAIDDPNVTYTTVMEGEDSGSEQMPVETTEILGQQQHVALLTQEDGTQQQVGCRGLPGYPMVCRGLKILRK